ncbi:MAG: hypothetical protein Q9166_008070 [cf. Caloplaca sp. 2 TL-2023]
MPPADGELRPCPNHSVSETVNHDGPFIGQVKSSSERHADQTLPPNEEAKRRSLFVHSLPVSATTERLTEVFSQSYPLKHATVVSDPTSKLSKGYGFVTFTDPSDALAALETFNGTFIDGQKIKVELAKPRSRDVKSSGGRTAKSTPSSAPARAVVDKGRKQLQNEPPPQLIVRNLPWTISEPEQLVMLFRSYGKVKRATLPKTKPGLSAGFGFVVLRGRKNTEKAMKAVNGKVVDGRTLAVDWAVGKSVWASMNQSSHRDAPLENPTPIAGKMLDAVNNGSEGLGIINRAEEAESHTDSESFGEPDEDRISNETLSETTATSKTKHDSSTLFLRNVPFTVTDEDLSQHFASFGPVRYARVVMDPSTQRSKGTAFVAFWEEADAIACLRAAPKAGSTSTYSGKTQVSTSKITSRKSILEDTGLDPSGRYTMDGRILQLSRAVDKGEATRLSAVGHNARDVRDRDKRRLYLLSEGTIPSETALYNQLAPSEIALREESARQRQNLIKNNPALHLSLTRLSVRNLPRSITSKDLKALAREAVVGFSRDVKAGLRQPLSKEELARARDLMREAERARKTKRKGIIKQSKVVFEGGKGEKQAESSGTGRSKGYAFIEYTSHRWALMGLRWLNGHAIRTRSADASNLPNANERKKRLIVEFAIENAQVVGRRQERETRSYDKRRSTKCSTRVNTNEDAQPLASGDHEPRSQAVKLAGVKRKRPLERSSSSQSTKDINGITPRDPEATDRLAKKQRIIGRNRMARKARKSK